MSQRSSVSNPLEAVAGDRTWRERLFLLWDFAIIALVSVNLALIISNALFSVGLVATGIGALWPTGHDWFQNTIHNNFVTIDLGFVGIFVADVLAGWTLAVVERWYYRWFFYPFVRWYDVLGCVPVAGLRFLRVLRLVSVCIRLQRLGVIDIRNWGVYRHAMVYYDIVVEEISDRVVIRVLSGAQEELRSGGAQLSQRVVSEVIEPRRSRLVRAAAGQLEAAVTRAYRDNREELQTYIAQVVNRGIEKNPALKNIERVPMLGGFISDALDTAITDTVNDVLDEAVAGLSSEDFEALVQHIADSVISRLLAEQGNQESDIRDAVAEVLDLVKEQVAVKRWRNHFE